MTSAEVAVICASFPPRICGIADYVSHFAEALRARGVRAEVVTAIGETECQPGIVSPVVPDWGIGGVLQLVHVLKVDKPKLVHLQWERAIYDQSPAIPLLLPILLKLNGFPLVTTFHSLDGPVGWGKLHRAALVPLLWGSRDIVVCSERQLKAVRRLPRLANRARLIPIGNVIPVEFQRPSERPIGPLRLVYFGFVWRGRNIEVLLRALKAVLAVDSGAMLEIVGGVKNEEYSLELARLAVELGVTGHVRFRGTVTAAEISRTLANADMVLLPFESGVSTGRTTLMAALAHNAPIVTMGAEDNLTPLFEDGVNMEIAQVGDEAGFIARAVALAEDSERRNRLSAGAAALAKELSWPSIAQQSVHLSAYVQANLAGATPVTVEDAA